MKDGQTIGQWLNWDFESNGNLTIKDKNGKNVYYEFPDGHWSRSEFDSQSRLIYIETAGGAFAGDRTPEVIEHNGRKYQLIP